MFLPLHLFFSPMITNSFFFFFILFIFLHLFIFSNSFYKSLLPLSHSLTIWPLSSSSISTSLWKPDTLGRVGTCLGWVLVEKSLRMSKNTLLCSFLRVQPVFMHTQVCSCALVSVLQFMHTQVPSCVCVQNSMYAVSFMRTHGTE